MENIEDYILLPREERQNHLKLETPCIERGGNSIMFRGLLADRLNTSIPKGHGVHLCHACHNGKCSNWLHLYWGTPSENRRDALENGELTIRSRTIAKHGEFKTKELSKRTTEQYKVSGAKVRQALKSKPKSEEHKRKIAETIRRKHAERQMST